MGQTHSKKVSPESNQSDDTLDDNGPSLIWDSNSQGPPSLLHSSTHMIMSGMTRSTSPSHTRSKSVKSIIAANSSNGMSSLSNLNKKETDQEKVTRIITSILSLIPNDHGLDVSQKNALRTIKNKYLGISEESNGGNSKIRAPTQSSDSMEHIIQPVTPQNEAPRSVSEYNDRLWTTLLDILDLNRFAKQDFEQSYIKKIGQNHIASLIDEKLLNHNDHSIFGPLFQGEFNNASTTNEKRSKNRQNKNGGAQSAENNRQLVRQMRRKRNLTLKIVKYHKDWVKRLENTRKLTGIKLLSNAGIFQRADSSVTELPRFHGHSLSMAEQCAVDAEKMHILNLLKEINTSCFDAKELSIATNGRALLLTLSSILEQNGLFHNGSFYTSSNSQLYNSHSDHHSYHSNNNGGGGSSSDINGNSSNSGDSSGNDDNKSNEEKRDMDELNNLSIDRDTLHKMINFFRSSNMLSDQKSFESNNDLHLSHSLQFLHSLIVDTDSQWLSLLNKSDRLVMFISVIIPQFLRFVGNDHLFGNLEYMRYELPSLFHGQSRQIQLSLTSFFSIVNSQASINIFNSLSNKNCRLLRSTIIADLIAADSLICQTHRNNSQGTEDLTCTLDDLCADFAEDSFNAANPAEMAEIRKHIRLSLLFVSLNWRYFSDHTMFKTSMIHDIQEYLIINDTLSKNEEKHRSSVNMNQFNSGKRASISGSNSRAFSITGSLMNTEELSITREERSSIMSTEPITVDKESIIQNLTISLPITNHSSQARSLVSSGLLASPKARESVSSGLAAYQSSYNHDLKPYCDEWLSNQRRQFEQLELLWNALRKVVGVNHTYLFDTRLASNKRWLFNVKDLHLEFSRLPENHNGSHSSHGTHHGHSSIGGSLSCPPTPLVGGHSAGFMQNHHPHSSHASGNGAMSPPVILQQPRQVRPSLFSVTSMMSDV